MKSPEEVTKLVKQRYQRQRWAWLDGGGVWPLQVGLDVPTQKAALADPGAVRVWSTSWATWLVAHPTDAVRSQPQLSTTTVAWRNVGEQTLPRTLAFSSAECVADYCGDGKGWRSIVSRRAMMLVRWPALQASGFGPNYTALGEFKDEDFERLLAVLEWLVANPRSGIYLRQLPVPNIDTKWIDLQRRGVVADLFRRITKPAALLPAAQSPVEDDGAEVDAAGQAASIQEASSNFYDICGLLRPPVKLRILVLCPKLRSKVGGLRDIEATVEDWAQLRLEPRQLLVVENKDTCLAMPDVDDVVAVIKLGNAVSLVTKIPWLENVPVLYWGDIDTYGYSILVQARKKLHDVRSVLMDRSTVETHLDRLVGEGQQAKTIDRSLLTTAELDVYNALLAHDWGASKRLEQERLEWPSALAQVLAALELRNSIRMARNHQ